MIRVLVFEDNPDYADGLKALLEDASDMEIAGIFENSSHALRYVNQLRPDVVLMDIDMPVTNGLEGLRQIRQENKDICILMQTVFEDNERVFQAICDGATGYILKKTPPDKMLDYIREAANGGAPMTPSIARQVLKMFAEPYKGKKNLESMTAREQDVLTLLVRGYSYKLIAGELNITLETVRSHIKNIYSKLQVRSKGEAIVLALNNGIR